MQCGKAKSCKVSWLKLLSLCTLRDNMLRAVRGERESQRERVRERESQRERVRERECWEQLEERERESERVRERESERESERERVRERESERERESQRERESERESQREREAAHLESTLRDNMLRGWHLERERARERNTFLCKDWWSSWLTVSLAEIGKIVVVAPPKNWDCFL